jgi:hypothetical protein
MGVGRSVTFLDNKTVAVAIPTNSITKPSTNAKSFTVTLLVLNVENGKLIRSKEFDDVYRWVDISGNQVGNLVVLLDNRVDIYSQTFDLLKSRTLEGSTNYIKSVSPDRTAVVIRETRIDRIVDTKTLEDACSRVEADDIRATADGLTLLSDLLSGSVTIQKTCSDKKVPFQVNSATCEHSTRLGGFVGKQRLLAWSCSRLALVDATGKELSRAPQFSPKQIVDTWNARAAMDSPLFALPVSVLGGVQIPSWDMYFDTHGSRVLVYEDDLNHPLADVTIKGIAKIAFGFDLSPNGNVLVTANDGKLSAYDIGVKQ